MQARRRLGLAQHDRTVAQRLDLVPPVKNYHANDHKRTLTPAPSQPSGPSPVNWSRPLPPMRRLTAVPPASAPAPTQPIALYHRRVFPR
jgi:hypothetical protein